MGKKILALALVLVMGLSMAACAGNNAPAATQAALSTTAAAPATTAAADATTAADAAAASEATTAAPADATTAAPAETSAAASGGSGVELAVWHYFAGEHEVAALERIVQAHAADVGNTATVTYVAREDLLKQYTMGAMSGELPDVGMVDNPDHASFAAMGVFQDITDLLDAKGDRDQYFEGPLLSCTYEGRLYGLPSNSNCLALFINNTMFEEKNLEPPTTWEELKTVCAALLDGNTNSGFYPFVMSCINDEEGTFQFMPWFIAAGGDISDLDSENTVRALDFLKGMVDDGFMSPEVINFRQADANTQFMNGLAAMQLNGPWNVPMIANDAPDLDYSVALVPKDQKFASVLGGENFAVCAGAPLEESFDLLYNLCSEEGAADFCESSGKFPPRSDSMLLRDVWTTDPIMSVFGEQLEYAMPRGPHPRWPEISKAMSTALSEVLTGAKTSTDALATAAATYDTIMSE